MPWGILWSFIFLLFFCSSCWVNHAVVDPWSFAPEDAACAWTPDRRAERLSCEESCPYPEISKEHILSLGEVLDIALINNPDTYLTWADAREAAAEYGKSQSTAFPEVTAQYYYTRNRTAFLASQVDPFTSSSEQQLFISTQSFWGPQALVNYTLFDFGQRRFTSEAARYSLYFANYTHNREIQTVIETLTVDYYNYLYQQKKLEANEADLATAEETLKAAELGLEKGVKDVSDVLQARTQELLSEIDLSEQRRAVKAAYSILIRDMGLPANIQLKFQKLPFVEPEEIELDPLEKYIEKAMCYRPDLLAARANAQSAEDRLTASKRQWLPTLDYSLTVGRTNFTGGFQDKNDFISTLTVSMPIFTGFWIRNDVRAHKAKLEYAEALVRQKELILIEEITQSHFNIGVAYDTLKMANNLLRAAQEQYRVARTQYRAGTNTILDLVSAQSSLFDARAKQAQATKEWFTAFADLTYSVGVSFEEEL